MFRCSRRSTKQSVSQMRPRGTDIENKLPPSTLSCVGRSRDDFEVLEAVKAGKWGWPQHVAVSTMGKAFVAGLLVVDPAQRLTCEDALNHCWMQVSRGAKNTGCRARP